MAYASFQEVLFYRPLHEVTIDRRFGDFLVVLDRLVVVFLERCQISDLEEELVCQSILKLVSITFFVPGDLVLQFKTRTPYASALSLSNHPAAVSYASIALFMSPISNS